MATKSLQILGSLNQTAVQFVEQELTEEEKAQARENIGAAGLDADGKVPLEQLPDNIGGTVSVEDVEGLMVETTVSETATIWEYYDGMVADTELAEDGMTQYLYKISDSIDPNDFIGNIISTAGGQEITVTSDMIGFDTGIFYVISVSTGEIMIFPTDLDWSNFGMSGITSAGSYALRVVAGAETMGAAKIQAMTEAVKSIINPDLLSNVASNVFWKDIKDKPFYEEGSGGTITWDGNTDGLLMVGDTIDIEGMSLSFNFYKMSDAILTKEQALGNSVGMMLDGTPSTAIADSASESSNNSFYIYNSEMNMPCIVCCAQDGDTLSVLLGEIGAVTLTFPESGVWFIHQSMDGYVGAYTTSFEIPSIIKTLDEKFIPDTIARKSDLDDVSVDLSNYYTKTETYDSWTIDNKIANVSVDLSGYYTKDEVYNKDEVDAALGNVSVDLSGYYTKTEIDEITGDINTVLDEISVLIGE